MSGRPPAPETAPPATPAERATTRAPARATVSAMVSAPARGKVPATVWAAALVAVAGTVAALLGAGVRSRFGGHVAVDEPQYLLTALSLFEDLDLDITDELDQRRWTPWAGTEPLPVQTEVLADGTQISPHDPLLPILLALPMGLGGWIAAKATMAVMAGALAALALWTAVRRFAVPLRLAAAGVTLAAVSAPLAVYGQQVYPELPAALAALAAVALLTGPAFAPGDHPRGRGVAAFGVVIIALPWLSVKYAPVAAAIAGLALWRLWRIGRGRADRRPVVALAAWFAAMGVVYLVVHRLVWGGWTVYASGDHFQESGEFGVMGFDPNYVGRASRLVGLMVDRGYGLAAWQPAWLLLLPAVGLALWCLRPRGALRHRRGAVPPDPARVTRPDSSRVTRPDSATAASSRPSSAVSPRPSGTVPPGPPYALPSRASFAALLLPLAAGWLTATFVALTMNGHWWPGRQLVVVLPLALLLVLVLLASRPGRLRWAGLTLGLAGAVDYAWLLADGYARRITWVSGFEQVGSPLYRLLRPVLPDYRLGWSGFWPLHLTWVLVSVLLVAYGMPYLLKGRSDEEDPDPRRGGDAGDGRRADLRRGRLRR